MAPHKLLVFSLFLGISIPLFSQTWIGTARTQSDGAVVTVKGIALNGPELGLIRYIQDETGGIALYPGTGSVPGLENVQAGDEVLVTGMLDPYQGLLELTPLISLEILSSGNPLPEPQTIIPAEFNEQRESEHVRLQCANFEETGIFEADQTYTLIHYNGIGFNLYIPEGHPLAGEAIPAYPVELSGILSRYNGFRVLVRGMEDLPESPCLYFNTEVIPTAIAKESISLSWETNVPCLCRLAYGADAGLANEIESPDQLPLHAFTLENLVPATPYYIRAYCQLNGAEVASPLRIFSTASNSSGQLEVYFNQSTDPSFSTGTLPSGSSWQEAEDAILERIDAAVSTIDAAVYNANLDDWVEALTQAHDRGVQVRYIFEDEASNSALSGSLPFPILEGNPGALMHNKFLSIDADDPAKAWLVTGSMNWTDSGLKTDCNNILIIQDQAIAKAYRVEFEEMWGGSGPQPVQAGARFGPAKVDNTPSYFSIGGRMVELYFTPSDRIVSLISGKLNSAEEDLFFGMFVLTMDELSAALKDVWFGGKEVRGIIEDPDISGSDFDFLLSQGVPVQEHEPYGLFHHKYALIDANTPGSDPMVITGSYNWTSAATTSNDENVVIIHDAAIANQFVQEFEARWEELVAVQERVGEPPLFQVYPNPNDGEFSLEYKGPNIGECVLRIWNSNGQPCGETQMLQTHAGQPIKCRIAPPIPGVYLITCTLQTGRVYSQKLIISNL